MEAALAEAPAPAEQEIAEEGLSLEGDGQLSFEVGGKAPTTSTLRLTGGRIELHGSYEKGQRIAVRVEAVVHSVEFKDEHDGKTGQVISCNRSQKARIVGVRVID